MANHGWWGNEIAESDPGTSSLAFPLKDAVKTSTSF